MKKIILIVDDSVAFHATITFAFGEYTLVSTYDEHGALSVVENTPVDMVLCDLNLNEESEDFDRGINLIRDIRKKKSELPIIAVTNYFEQREHWALVSEFGATNILYKKDYNIKNWKETFHKLLDNYWK
ncbi:MAG: response regulator [Bacteroidota bacterium]